ncbi:CRISPR-associated protein Cas2 [Olavius algarvensis spirochete endosymbiont]|uniref:CRISPR-associated endonuclease Cas2 n=1 Tax=Olavius algarvensis spirochete endosymbiont TaxID=260710 RepID=UPI000F276F37|nr:CRISPR-associated endonuclease Cas2 [Olavius algarvensis spirochete endosymbiont]VDA98953.1 CRISPR-associated protein Cas2 [Olavius algarvensis spirochete endosymbiont]
MLVLVSYDVSTGDSLGARRLRRVGKICEDYGQRVQYSLFECLVDPGLWLKMKKKLESVIDFEKDSLRYYYLGSNWKRKIEHVGAKPSYNPEGTLIV